MSNAKIAAETVTAAPDAPVRECNCWHASTGHTHACPMYVPTLDDRLRWLLYASSEYEAAKKGTPAEAHYEQRMESERLAIHALFAESVRDDRLTFSALRAANTARLPLFKNKRGGPAHSEPDGSDWSLGEWCNAVLGELGEAANLIKKVKRGDVTLDEARPELAKEYADVVTYLDILAFRTGVDLGAVTAAKWDEVSARVGAPLRIADFHV